MLRIPLGELGFGPKKPMVLFCYNKAAIEMQCRTKHVELNRNYIKDNLDSGQITIPYIRVLINWQ